MNKPGIIIFIVIIAAVAVWYFAFYNTSEDTDVSTNTSSTSTTTSSIGNDANAIVYVECPLDDDDEWVYFGSGALIHTDGYFLTNDHIVNETNEFYCNVGIIDNVSEFPELTYYAEVVTAIDQFGEEVYLSNSSLDVAILQIVDADTLLPTTFPTISKVGTSGTLMANDALSIAGFPTYENTPLAVTDSTFTGPSGSLLELPVVIDEGTSGGAIFNSAGEFIGTPVWDEGGKYGENNYAVGVDWVITWLENENLDPADFFTPVLP
ncbi:serine protease [Patescibacteria group bacterium]